MKKIRFSWFLVLLLLVPATALTHNNPAVNPPGSARPPDTVIAVVAADLPPTYSRDPQSGKPVGFAIDTMEELCRRAGLKITYVYGKPWDEMQQMLLSGQVDLIPSMFINDRRKQVMLFTDPIETMPINYIVRKGDSALQAPTAGMKVGVMKGSTAENLLKNRHDLNCSGYDSMYHLLMELLAGRIDMVATSTPNILKLAIDAGVDDQLRVIEPPVIEGQRAIALRPDDRELQQRLNAVIGPYVNSSEYRALYGKWWGKPRPFWDAERVALVLGGLLCVVTAALLLWRFASISALNRSLQREVAEREATNRNLQEAITVAREMSDEAQWASQAKSAFLANMSHELRTPLNGMLGMLQLLEGTNPTVEQASFIAPALKSGWNLLELLDDILDLTRIESGRLELSHEPVALTRLAQTVMTSLALQAQDKGLMLSSSIAVELPPLILGDEKRLRQILFNLVGNALKFTPAGTVELNFAAGPEQADGRQTLLMSVKDTGIGIAPEQLERIFEPFTQGEIDYRKRFQGVGLGLAIVNRLVTAMGGQLRIDSTPGQGTTVVVELPIATAVAPIVAVEPVAAAPAAVAALPLQVLLVEDNEDNLQLLTLMIRREHHRVTQARNGQEALARLAEADFDLVLMDIQMPVMDGLTALQHIRAGNSGVRNPLVPVVALTAYAMSGDRETFLAAGMNDYLPKPVVRARLDALLGRYAGGLAV